MSDDFFSTGAAPAGGDFDFTTPSTPAPAATSAGTDDFFATPSAPATAPSTTPAAGADPFDLSAPSAAATPAPAPSTAPAGSINQMI